MPAHPCAVCCTLFSGIGIILLVMFGFLFKTNNITLYVRAHMANPPWDMDAKAQTCFIAAGIYGGFMLLSMFFVVTGKIRDPVGTQEVECEKPLLSDDREMDSYN
eukprot:PhF_6_TR12305/c0_g1_i1/m.19544